MCFYINIMWMEVTDRNNNRQNMKVIFLKPVWDSSMLTIGKCKSFVKKERLFKDSDDA